MLPDLPAAASLPSRERGLKSDKTLPYSPASIVAPFAGAWIEIHIEELQSGVVSKSLPSRERGLKLVSLLFYEGDQRSLPSRERGLKYIFSVKRIALMRSLPSRERGLKFFYLTFTIC